MPILRIAAILGKTLLELLSSLRRGLCDTGEAAANARIPSHGT